jgi:carboxypeptidase PM20D1
LPPCWREHLRHGSRQLDVPPAPPLAVDENAAAARLAEAIQRPHGVQPGPDATQNADQFQQLQALLQARYPEGPRGDASARWWVT